MRILLITTDLDHIEPYQFIGAQRKGADVAVVCGHDCRNLEGFADANIPVTRIEFRGRRNRANIVAIRKAIEGHQPDIVHVLRKQALLATIPALVNSTAKLIAYRGIVGNLSFFDPLSLVSFLHPRVDRIVCVAEAIRQHFLSMGMGPIRLAPEKLVTIHKGHDMARYQAVAPLNLAELGVPEGHAVIGFCGAMRPRKGVDLLVQAFSQMTRPNVALLLIGDIKDKRIHRAIDQSPKRQHILLPGKVDQDQALAINGAIDVATMPSIKREGLPRALIEAMAQGTPAVVTNVGGSPELVEHEVSGLVVPPNDVDALAAGLDRILEPECLEAMGRQAKLRMHDQFNVERTIEQNWALYQQLLAQ